jgi:hypothetical protein
MKVENIFKKIIYLQFILFIILVIKYFFFPNSIAPADLSFAIKRYSEEIMPDISYPIYVVFLIILIINLFSLFKLLKFSNFWRQVYLFTFIFIMLLTFLEKFSYIDSLEIFLEDLTTICSTILLTMSFLPPLNKKFK